MSSRCRRILLQRQGAALIAVGLLMLATSATGAQPTVPLGRASSFAVLAGSSVVSTGETLIVGNVGVWPGTQASIPPGTVSGFIHTGNVAAADAQQDFETAFSDAAARSDTNAVLVAGDLGGQTLTPGLYRSSASLEITSGDLTLSAQGNSNAVFIFQVPSTFTVGTGRRVLLARGARAARIFWQTSDSVTLGPGSVTHGNILARNFIDIQPGARLNGRALAQLGAVTLDSATVRLPSGGPGPPPPGPVGVDVLTPVTFNPQTGLLEQTVRVTNAASNAVAAVQVAIRRLPRDVTVYNKSGRTFGGKPYLQYNVPLAVGEGVDLDIEYFRANRRPFVATNFSAIAVGPVFFFAQGGPPKRVLRTITQGPDKNLVEFAATRGERYVLLYSDDGEIWKTARPPITATANRMFWVDGGPPKTESIPSSGRRYRVVELR